MDTTTPQIVFDEPSCMDAGWNMDPREQESAWHAADVARISSGPTHHEGCSMGMRQIPCDPVQPVQMHVKSCARLVAMTAKAARSKPHLARRTLLLGIHGSDTNRISLPPTRRRRSRSRTSVFLPLVHFGKRLTRRAPACADDLIEWQGKR